MSRAEALRLGPFEGGLNTASDPTAVADSELVDCVNFELDIDGSLVSRPPIFETVNMSATWTERIVIIGRAVLAGGNYLIGSNATGTYAFDGTIWTTILADLESRVALQYRDNVYIVPAPGCAVDGGRWDGTTWTTQASMPHGEAAVFHKSRMFIAHGKGSTADTSRLYYTDPITSVTLPWVGLLTDISPGDGEKLIDVIVYNDNLLLFKQDSTYVLAYDIFPSDAILRKISSTLGCTTRRCIVQYENSVFIFHEGSLYEIVNYDFQRINLKVPFLYDGSTPSTRAEEVFISILGDRLIVKYYNRIYSYGLKTRTWTRWESTSINLHNFGPLVSFPSNPTESVNVKYYSGSSILSNKQVYCIQDGYDSGTIEETLAGTYTIFCTLLTKNFDVADSHHFKKLMWWGADILTTQGIVGFATPIVSSYRIRWRDLSALTWDSLSTKTWLQPLDSSPNITTTITDLTVVNRKFVKFLKTLRFRQISFSLILKNNGSTLQGPCRVFTLTAIIGSKQTVGKQVN